MFYKLYSLETVKRINFFIVRLKINMKNHFYLDIFLHFGKSKEFGDDLNVFVRIIILNAFVGTLTTEVGAHMP